MQMTMILSRPCQIAAVDRVVMISCQTLGNAAGLLAACWRELRSVGVHAIFIVRLSMAYEMNFQCRSI